MLTDALTTEQLLRSQLFGCILPFMGKSLSSKEVIKILKADGWTLARVNGSHHQFTHPTKSGVVTVPHPKKGLKKGTQHAIFKLAGIKPP